MGFELLCTTLIALIVGLVLCFGGYRLFLFLLPIWAFFFGFFLGIQALQALFGIGFLATITSWVVGFLVGAAFAVLAYLFYAIGIAVVAGSLGYGLGAGFMHLIGIDFSLLVFVVGVAVAIVVIAITFLFNLQKYVIVILTAFGGAGVIIGTLLLGPARVGVEHVYANPVSAIGVLDLNPLWAILYLVLGVAGIVVQLAANRDYEVEAYDSRI